MYISSSSSLRHAISTDIPDLLLPPLPIVHCFRQVFRVTSRIGIELLYVGPQERIPYELVSTFPAVSRMFGSSNLDSFRDGWLVPVQLLLCGVLPP